MFQVKEKIDLPTRELAESFFAYGKSQGFSVRDLTEFKRNDGPALFDQLKSIKEQLKEYVRTEFKTVRIEPRPFHQDDDERTHQLLVKLFDYTCSTGQIWSIMKDKRSPDGAHVISDYEMGDLYDSYYGPRIKFFRILKSLQTLIDFRVEHLLEFLDPRHRHLDFVNDASERDPYWNLRVFPVQAARDQYLQKYVPRVAAVLEGLDAGRLPAEFYPEVREIIREIQEWTRQNHLTTFVEYSYQVLVEELLDEVYSDYEEEEPSCVPIGSENLYLTLFDYGYEHGFEIPADLTQKEQVEKLLAPIKEHLLEDLDSEVIQDFIDQAQRKKHQLYLLPDHRLVLTEEKKEGLSVTSLKRLLDFQTYPLQDSLGDPDRLADFLTETVGEPDLAPLRDRVRKLISQQQLDPTEIKAIIEEVQKRNRTYLRRATELLLQELL